MKYEVTAGNSRSLPEIGVDLNCFLDLKLTLNFSLSKKHFSMALAILSNKTFSLSLSSNRLSKRISPDKEDIGTSKENNSQAAQGD